MTPISASKGVFDESDEVTCSIVSKLNVKPFQSVNSPLDAPVTKRLPSGVQHTQNIGHLILFVEVRTNLVVTQFIGLSNIEIGGISCKTKRNGG